MKKIILLFLLIPLALTGFSTTWIVNTSGFSFSPANLTIAEGDSVFFDIDNIHNSIEVSQTTWNANGNSPLAGGWSLPLGGGLVLPADLTEGMHWYVCGPHANGGMKGTILVEGVLYIGEPPSPPTISLFPNPTDGYVQLTLNSLDFKSQYDLEIFNILGDKVYAERRLEQDAVIELNLSGLAQGTYIIKLYDGVYVDSRKLVIQ
jgi:plastocyanin